MKKRVLLKISGETLSGPSQRGFSPERIERLISEIRSLREVQYNEPLLKSFGEVEYYPPLTCELAIVIGGGNIFRGSKEGKKLGMFDKNGRINIRADYMGMLATILNGEKLQDSLEKSGFDSRHMSAIAMPQVTEPYIRQRAKRHLEKGRAVILTAGTGNPKCTTDSAMVLRATELQADLVLKGTKVDGVYDKDPLKEPNATLLPRISYGQFLQSKNFNEILDATAVSAAREAQISIRVFNIFTEGNLRKIVDGEDGIGSLVSSFDD